MAVYSRCRLLIVLFILIINSQLINIFAQAPVHPRLLQQIKSGVKPMPMALSKSNELKQRGIDAPWTARQLQEQSSNFPNQFHRSFGPAQVPTGTYKALVILVKFTDKPSQVNAVSFDNLLFGSSQNTLRDYYKEVSYDNLDIVTVNLPSSLGWQTAPQTYSYYVNGNNGFNSYPQNAQKLVEDAVNLVNPTVDFSQYDNDHDGYVDALFIVHSGQGAEYTGSLNDIWSHAWTTHGSMPVDGVNVYHYSMEPEYWASAGDMTCGVYAHEMGHAAFGLPDVYDRDYTSEGLGHWSLMAGGSWNGPSGFGASPAFPDAWSHAQMGYVTPTVVTSNVTSQAIQAVETNPQVYLLWKDGVKGSQYFLVENRQQTGYDTYLPGSGLNIYHVDETVTTQNDNEWYPGHTSGGHYLVALEQADGLWNLEHNSGVGDTGDPFPGSANNLNFSNSTTPDSKDYMYSATEVGVKNISGSASTMYADFQITSSEIALKIVSPNGGESFQVGYTKQIIVDALNTGSIKVEYSTDNGNTWNLIDNMEPSQRKILNPVSVNIAPGINLTSNPEKNVAGNIINWVVPNTPSTQCKIRATSISDPTLTDMSDNTFSIISYVNQGLATLKYDDGIHRNNIGTAGSATFQTSARFTQNIVAPYNGWSITKLEIYVGDLPLSMKIKIYDAGTDANPGILLHSQDFTPTPNSLNIINLSSPVPINNRDIWVGYEVSLSGNNPMGVDGGPADPNGDWIFFNGAWQHLADLGFPNNWMIHAVCENLSYIHVISPNGGEQFKAGTQKEIKWASPGIDNVKIEYSIDNCESWTEITSGITANTCSYKWTVPNTISNNCKVKISNVSNPSVYDESDNVFAIRAPGIIAEIEPNNSQETAMQVAISDTVDASISTVGDIDYYKINGVQGDTLVVYAEDRGSSELTANMSILDNDGNYLIKYIQSYANDSYKQKYVYILPYSGDYYIRYAYWNNFNGLPKPGENELKKQYPSNEKSNLPEGTYFDQGEYRITFNYFKKSAPVFALTSAEDQNIHSIRFYGSIYPNGLPTKVIIDYGLTTSFGSSITITENANGLNEWNFVSDKITGLQANTTYYLRVTLQNLLGTVTSNVGIISTPEMPDGWAFQNSGITKHLRAVDFIDSNNGVAVGDSAILITTDGGNSWINKCPQTLLPNGRGVEMISNSKIVAVGSSIQVTTDGGNSWVGNTFSNFLFYGVSFIDANTGVAVNSVGEIYKTIDGGTNWNKLNLGVSVSGLLAVKYLANNIIIAAGTNGSVIRSTDGGTSWTKQQIGDNTPIRAISFRDNHNGLIISDLSIFKTTDAGSSWTMVSSYVGHWLNGIVSIDANIAYAIGSEGGIIKATNSYVDWVNQNSGTYNFLRGVTAIDENNITAVGDWGTILRSIPHKIITLLSPDGGELWQQGTKKYIRWNSSAISSVKIEYSSDNGTSWNLVTSSAPAAAGVFTWDVPNILTNQALIRISDASDANISNISNAAFSIITSNAPEISIASVGAAAGDSVKIPITVSKFNGIGAITLVIEYDPSVLSFGRALNWNPQVTDAQTNSNSGTISISWAGLSAVNIQNGKLADLKFLFNGSKEQSLLKFRISECEIANTEETVLLTGYSDGIVIKGSGNNLSGKVTYANNESTPLDNVRIILSNSGTIQDSTTTNSCGDYLFSLLQDASYLLQPKSNFNWGGVNATDALGLLRHVVGKAVQTDTLVLKAMDVNASKTINATDALAILRRVVGKISSFPAGDWALENPLVEINGIDAVQNIRGLCMGDVNRSYIPALAKSNPLFAVSSEGEIDINKQGEFTIPVRLKNPAEVGAVTVVLNYPKDLVEIKSVEMSKEGMLYNAEDGVLRIAWNNIEPLKVNAGGELLRINFNTKKEMKAGSELNLSLGSETELADAEGKVIEGLNIVLPNAKVSLPKEYKLSQNYPNPFNPTTVIEYDLPEEGRVSLEIYNILGEKVQTIVNQMQEAGSYRAEWNASGYPSGVYIFRINAEGKTKNYIQTKKMTLIK